MGGESFQISGDKLQGEMARCIMFCANSLHRKLNRMLGRTQYFILQDSEKGLGEVVLKKH